MSTIHKYTLHQRPGVEQVLQLNGLFLPLSVGLQRTNLVLWLTEEPKSSILTKVTFLVLYTGDTTPEGYIFLGTVQTERELVLHIFYCY